MNTMTRSLAWSNQLQYGLPRALVASWLDLRGIQKQSDIWIRPLYPSGYEAVVAAWNRVWIFRYNIRTKELVIKDIQHVQGFYPNGMLIIS